MIWLNARSSPSFPFVFICSKHTYRQCFTETFRIIDKQSCPPSIVNGVKHHLATLWSTTTNYAFTSFSSSSIALLLSTDSPFRWVYVVWEKHSAYVLYMLQIPGRLIYPLLFRVCFSSHQASKGMRKKQKKSGIKAISKYFWAVSWNKRCLIYFPWK